MTCGYWIKIQFIWIGIYKNCCHFVRTILSVPFCPIPFCPVTAIDRPTSIVHAKLDYCNSFSENRPHPHSKLFRMLSPTWLLFSKNSTYSKYLNESNTKQYYSPTTRFNPFSPFISSLKNSDDHFLVIDPKSSYFRSFFPHFHHKNPLFLPWFFLSIPRKLWWPFLVIDLKCVSFLLFHPHPIFITAKTPFHHCTFSFITAHFVHHCTLKHALPIGSVLIVLTERSGLFIVDLRLIIITVTVNAKDYFAYRSLLDHGFTPFDITKLYYARWFT